VEEGEGDDRGPDVVGLERAVDEKWNIGEKVVNGVNNVDTYGDAEEDHTGNGDEKSTKSDNEEEVAESADIQAGVAQTESDVSRYNNSKTGGTRETREGMGC
jgi:hypothetical protein